MPAFTRSPHRLLPAVACCVAALFSPAANAQAQAQPQFTEGLYIAGGAGFNFLPNTSVRLDSATVTNLAAAGYGNTATVGFAPGFAGVLSLGWGFGNGLRAEIEGLYRSNETSGSSGVAGWAADGGINGSQESWGVMGNVMLDLGQIGPVMPYIGIGAGYVVTDWSGVRGISQNGALRMTVNDSDGQFAYQGIAGLAFPLSFAPGLALTAEYRFLGTLQPRLQARFDNPITGATIARGTAEPDAYNQSVMLGLRYAFSSGAAAPVPPPAAAPVQSRSFIVFFDWNRADLTERARQIIAEAAQQARAQRTTRIEVAGHADRSGTVQYNQALSRRRAETVAAELIRLGVSRDEIAITALGESQPLVPTADDAREPQNRRVEIVLR